MASAVEVVDNASFFQEMRPNRSLSPVARQRWFMLLAGTVFLVAGFATVIGAWMVLPFAGFEVFFLWCAFQWIARHDGDYEWVRISDQQFCWTQCKRGQVEVLSGNAAWAQVIKTARDGRLVIDLRYQGRIVSIGQMISDEQRELLCRNLLRVMKKGAAP